LFESIGHLSFSFQLISDKMSSLSQLENKNTSNKRCIGTVVRKDDPFRLIYLQRKKDSFKTGLDDLACWCWSITYILYGMGYVSLTALQISDWNCILILNRNGKERLLITRRIWLPIMKKQQERKKQIFEFWLNSCILHIWIKYKSVTFNKTHIKLVK